MTQTPEQVAAAAAQAKAETAAQKQAEKDSKAAAKAQKDAEKQATADAKAQAKAAKDAERQATKDAKEKEKADKLAAKEQEKAQKEATKNAAKMPEANGIRQPKPESLCGKAWAIFNQISAQNGAPASITDALPVAKAQGLNEGNVRTEYARWKKFHGVTGRVAPVAQTTAPADPANVGGTPAAQ